MGVQLPLGMRQHDGTPHAGPGARRVAPLPPAHPNPRPALVPPASGASRLAAALAALAAPAAPVTAVTAAGKRVLQRVQAAALQELARLDAAVAAAQDEAHGLRQRRDASTTAAQALQLRQQALVQTLEWLDAELRAWDAARSAALQEGERLPGSVAPGVAVGDAGAPSVLAMLDGKRQEMGDERGVAERERARLATDNTAATAQLTQLRAQLDEAERRLRALVDERILWQADFEWCQGALATPEAAVLSGAGAS